MIIKNYIKIALRNIFRNKLYSFLNIAGLSIGIACFILILFYVQDELSYDRFHEKADRIHRANLTFDASERVVLSALTTHNYGPMLKDEFPEIAKYVRFSRYGQKKIIQYEDYTFYEGKFLWVDPTLFEVFSFTLLRGNPEEALIRPNSVVITEEMAEKYFGDEDPIGKNLLVDTDDLYEVTGVMESIPMTSHIRPDFFASMSTLNLKSKGNVVSDLISEINFYTYLLLPEEADPIAVESKFNGFMDKHLGPVMKAMGGSATLDVQPLTSIYLHSDREGEMERTSDIAYVYLFSGIGLFILLLACLNFMNLSTARSANRAKEVGLRKVVGAQKRQLVFQFLGESTMLAFISVIVAFILVFASLGVFRNISGKDMNVNFISNPILLVGIIGLLIVVGLIGGSYPAFFLSAFRPVDTIQGKLKRGSKRSLMRIALVTLQFTVSIVLIIGTLIVNRQLNYVRNKKLGYEKDHVLTVQMRNPDTQKRYESLKNVFRQHPNILAVSASGTTPLGFNDFRAEHAVGTPPNEHFMMFVQHVDSDFIDLYDMKIIEGRNFSTEFPSDPKSSIIINETTAKRLGWKDNPINQEIEVASATTMSKEKHRVVGVVQDYHFQSLHEKITPLVLFNKSLFGHFSMISVKVRPENIQETIGFLKSKWQEFDPNFPFEYSFVDDQFDELYRTEERMTKLFGYFTALAIIIGCLGLFGLTSFIAEQRTKEIGIRKILGASSQGIVMMLVREFTKWIMLAVIIAWPVGYFLMNSWLQNFAYRAALGFGVFLVSAILALLVAVLTVSFQAIRAAVANPADSLRNE
ncbi:ABC transporter permease [Acidobacteriota bacterium]